MNARGANRERAARGARSILDTSSSMELGAELALLEDWGPPFLYSLNMDS